MQAPLPWSTGDLYTLGIAVVVFLLGCCLHSRAIRAQGTGCTDIVVGLMASGLTVGPLLMIVLDPLNKGLFRVLSVDMLGLVMNEARTSLWFACFLALVNTTMSILKSRSISAAALTSG